MRAVAFILLCYLSALLTLPCSDQSNRCDNTNSTAQASPHRHSQDKDDNCTPFCHCSCCSISIATYHFRSLDFKVLPPECAHDQPALRADFVLDPYVGNIWQPPRHFAS
ncbi:DUF6660 family protein [Niabella insulamsoli]|uniref:DUF6660 family protein n=1 Tax=Niabella insulamsoli TaxID=3144874 RepID=UPI003CCC642C